MHEFHEWLRRAHHTDIEQHFVPKPSVEEMQHCVLATADVQIHRHPIAFLGLVDKLG